MMLEPHLKFGVAEADSPEKMFCPKNWENGLKISQKQGFFEYIEKFCY